MTASDAGKVDVQYLCKLAGVSRASYYRRFEARAPCEADVELTSHIPLLCLRHRFYGYRRITAVFRRSEVPLLCPGFSGAQPKGINSLSYWL
jgi:putative transposase